MTAEHLTTTIKNSQWKPSDEQDGQAAQSQLSCLLGARAELCNHIDNLVNRLDRLDAEIIGLCEEMGIPVPDYIATGRRSVCNE